MCPLHLAFPFFVSPSGMSELQIYSTAPDISFLPLTCISVGFSYMHHCTWSSLYPSHKHECQIFNCTTPTGLPCLHLTCESVRTTDVHTAPSLLFLPLPAGVSDYRRSPLHPDLPVSMSSARVSVLQMCTTAHGLPFLHLTCLSFMITDVHT